MIRQKFITLLSLMTLIALYFWGHNTGSAGEALRGGLRHTLQMVADLGSVLALVVIAGGIGRRVLRPVDFTALSVGERVVIDSLTGLGIISLIAVTAGLLGFFNLVIAGIVLILALITFPQILSWLRDARDLMLNSGRPASPWERFVRAYLMIALVAALLLALAPPFAWDGINYHLVVPARYLAEGSIGQHLDNHFFGFPQNMEMLNGLLMMIGSDRTPAVLHFMLGLFGLVAVYNFVRRHASAKAASVAVLVMMASFNIWLLFGWPYVDLALMTYGFVAVIAIHQWQPGETNAHRWLILSAIMASLAGGIKYTAAPLIIGLYLLVLWRDRKHVVQNTLIFGGFGVLLFVPWLVKGTLLYGNPLYPYIFDGTNWDAIRSANFSETGKGLLGLGLGFQIPLIPFSATIFGIDKVIPYRFTTGVFLFTLPFVLLIGWRKLPDLAQSAARTVLPLALVVLGFWMVIAALSGIGGQTRLMIVLVPLAAVLGALAYHSIENWPRRPIDMVFILQAMMIVTVFFGIFDYVKHFADTRVLEYHAGSIDDDQYLTTNMGALYNAMLALETLPEDSDVLFLWEPKAYHCPETLNCTGDLLFDNWARPIQMGSTPDEVLAGWQDSYDYVLLFDIDTGSVQDGYSLWSTYHEFAVEQNRLFPDAFFDSVVEVWTDGIAYTVYRWE